jgi:hypothetical protein
VYQRPHVVLRQLVPAAEKVQFYYKQKGCDLAADAFDEVGDGSGGAAGGQQVVDDEHAVTVTNGVLMHLERVLAVFEVVRDRDLCRRELPGLSDGNETGRDLVCDRRGKNKPSRFDPDDRVDLAVGKLAHETVDRVPEALGIEQQRRDVVKGDARLGKIAHLANEVLEMFHVYRSILNDEYEPLGSSTISSTPATRECVGPAARSSRKPFTAFSLPSAMTSTRPSARLRTNPPT